MANVIDSLSFDNVKYSLTLPYGSCSTAAATAAKVVTVNNFDLDTGSRIAVKFTVTNTASSPTLNVNNTGAKAIYYRGSAISAGYLASGRTYEFVYNGTQWEVVGDIDTNSDKKASSGNSSSKLFLIGATSQSSSGQTTYSHDTAYVGTDGCLYSNSTKVSVEGHTHDYAASGHTHNYAGSSSAGGSATSAVKLDSSAGSATQPIYFSGGKPVACTYYVNKTVPADAVFTDTTYSAFVKSGTGAKAGLVPAPSTTAGTTKYLREDGTWSVPPDNNTTYSAASQSAAGLMSAADKKKLDGIATGATANTGDITGVTAGNGLTGGGSSGSVTLNVGAGTGITVAADTVSANLNSTTSLGTIGTTGKLYAVGVDANGKLCVNVPWTDTNTDTNTCNTAGSHEKSDKLFLVGCLSQGPYYETFSNSKCYASGGYLYSNNTKVSVEGHTHSYAASGHTHDIALASSTGTSSITLAHGSKYQLTAGGKSIIFTMPSDNNTTYGVVSTSANGLAPKSPGGTTAYLRADGTWATPPDTNTTYGTMGAASSSAAGSSGLVPAPAKGKQSSFLRGDGTWATPTNTTYNAATQSAAGLMSADDKKKLDGIATGANNYTYTLPNASSSTLGGVKVGSNISVSSGTISLTKANVTAALGYTPPTSDTNTTYSAGTGISLSGTTFSLNSGYYATSTNSGLMSAADKAKLDGIASGANNYTYTLPSATSSTLGGVKVGSNISVSSGTISLTKANVTSALGYTPPTTNTTYGVVSTSANGLAPKLPGGTTQYLRADGTWATPPDTNTTYGVVSRTANGLMASHYYAHLMDHTHNYLSNGSGDLAFASGTGWSSFSIGRTSKNGILTLNRGSGYMDIQVGSSLTSNVTIYLPALGGTVYTTNNRPSAADCGAAASGHSHTSLSTLTTSTLTVNSASSSMFTVKYNNASKFRVDSNGGVYGSKYYTSGADYSEYMEWQDQNLDAEDRRGYFVTVDDCETIRIANSEDDVIGVVSSTPSVIGNDATFHWSKQYLTDIYGETLFEEVEYPETVDEEGNVIPAHTEMEPIINPEYDPTREYIPRNQRPEWAAIGMLGQLVVRDDGTCKAGKYCKCNDDGIATLAEGRNGWRVLKRLDEHHIKILFR